jgi:hypothetical protein
MGRKATATATTTTVREFLARHGRDAEPKEGLWTPRGFDPEGITRDVEAGEGRWLDLVSFGQGKNFLRLIRQPDGRIDLVDYNCDDTGSDLGDDDVSTLKSHIEAWLAVITNGEEPCDDDSEPELFPLD